MIRGRFDADGRPFLEARVYIRSLKISADIPFLVDTGADRTVVMPTDGARLNINYEKLSDPITSLGIGGASEDFQVDATIFFKDEDESLVGYSCKLVVTRPAKEKLKLPSLLGRNVLDRWNLTYNARGQDIHAHYHDADFIHRD